MTNEEMRRTMDFIVEQQAQFAASMQQLEEERRRDAPRLAQLEQSFKVLVQLAENTDARLDTLDSRSDALETDMSAFRERQSAYEARMSDFQATFDANMITLQQNMTALAASQSLTDERLRELIAIVRQDRNGKSQSQ